MQVQKEAGSGEIVIKIRAAADEPPPPKPKPGMTKKQMKALLDRLPPPTRKFEASANADEDLFDSIFNRLQHTFIKKFVTSVHRIDVPFMRYWQQYADEADYKIELLELDVYYKDPTYDTVDSIVSFLRPTVVSTEVSALSWMDATDEVGQVNLARLDLDLLRRESFLNSVHTCRMIVRFSW